MCHRSRFLAPFALAATLLAVAPPGLAGGFHIFEQGSKALGMANAYTAQADDPSAMYFNVGGLAFQDERDFMAGVTLISLGDSTFTGVPGPGGVIRGDQKSALVTPIHFYWVEPIRENLTFGLGVESPFGLVTEWEDDFAGRLISRRAELVSIDINPNLAWKVNDTFGIGIGLIGRASTVELDRSVGAVNPFTQSGAEVATVNIKSDLDYGFGFNVGMLHRPNDFFSWGLSYRSAVDVDYGGDGRFTQVLTGNGQFDALVPTLIPIGTDLPVETTIEFPATASFGMAFQVSDTVLFETDLNWAGWSVFDTTTIAFTSQPSLTSRIESNWHDAYNYRVGFAVDGGNGSAWRFGYYFDETPQPTSTVGPLLPDADRNGISVGYGRDGERLEFDVALLYLLFEDRTTLTNQDNFFGTYETNTILLSGSVGW